MYKFYVIFVSAIMGSLYCYESEKVAPGPQVAYVDTQHITVYNNAEFVKTLDRDNCRFIEISFHTLRGARIAVQFARYSFPDFEKVKKLLRTAKLDTRSYYKDQATLRTRITVNVSVMGRSLAGTTTNFMYHAEISSLDLDPMVAQKLYYIVKSTLAGSIVAEQ